MIDTQAHRYSYTETKGEADTKEEARSSRRVQHREGERGRRHSWPTHNGSLVAICLSASLC